MHVAQHQFLSSYFQHLLNTLEHEMQSSTNTELTHMNNESHISSLIEKYTIIPIQLHFDRETVSPYQKQISTQDLTATMSFGRGINRYDTRPVDINVLVYHLPYLGEATLLKYDPTCSNRMSLPTLTIQDNEISFEVAINEHNPDEAGQWIKTYKSWIQQQVGYINTDIASHNTLVKNRIPLLVNQKIQKQIKLAATITNMGIPLRTTDITKPTNQPSPMIANYFSAAISYGGLDEPTVTKLNAHLKKHGIKTWFFPDDAVPGDKLHRTMFEMANDYDKVLLICSKTSLSRHGVINEIERVLEREANEGGRAILIPVRLDDFVLQEWAPSNCDIASQIRSRVIGKLNVNNFECEETQNQLKKILLALTKKQ